ncbi:MAG TPA: amino acid ABC transporter permease [Dongiaceae bacterium]|jgi:polar amino acid transport system permease protein|nr:amino acid ABC transporter permease [Dongiaceae bacterium]
MSARPFGNRATRGAQWREPRPPADPFLLTLTAFFVTGGAVLLGAWSSDFIRASLKAGGDYLPWMAWLLYGWIAIAIVPAAQAFRAYRGGRRRAEALRQGDIAAARIAASESRGAAWTSIAVAFFLFILLGLGIFLFTNDRAVGRTFFSWPIMRDTFGLILRAFGLNVTIFCVTEIFVLVWGLVVALARLAPGRAGGALRMLAIAYTDIFRGLPSIITLYLIGFGLPLTGLPIFAAIPTPWLAILALTLTYGAYVTEVYRAGIESVHDSQIAAARSLGLTHLQTMRYVVVPQALRRIGPPLLNDFIGLQKDTALVNVIGAIDAFNQAKIIASNHFNLSAVTTVGLLFVLILIPQTRFVDWWIARDARERRAGRA